ncbi:YhcN/YlaJ family sporulation lipoprotein [Aquibacillus sp. 3ASR75-11]|uniref:YhcN/YlaJ family sporulation lipoprotein n=1 Tax=Terrihalobacillus insolitus TaxID=2950438 RepID=A0A9X3WPR7_9BACI|nr:YhcN/YlaJ family sporulation lipoprotein [Terrihalobacillus insolitus]MDC3412447.1 YhcN/YlaJ family sporulation lipoprotein [Terrihalobacillus insolitus]MDC3423867.1 YhcN/YlaJ family sporulation lipoprotein [Terrihalobacillus insolitus]
MRKKWLFPIFTSLSLFMVGCNDAEEAQPQQNQQQEDLTEMIRYDQQQVADDDQEKATKKDDDYERGGDLDGYLKDIDKPDGQDYEDRFYNEESAAVIREINKLEEVKLTQAFVTDEKVIVAVMLHQEGNLDVEDEIKSIVEKIVPNREIEVFTEDVYWNKIRNLNSR